MQHHRFRQKVQPSFQLFAYVIGVVSYIVYLCFGKIGVCELEVDAEYPC
jgi:hypothetical protein